MIETQPKKKRGTIVVDMGELISASLERPQAKTNSALTGLEPAKVTNSYLDILYLLAENGFEIVFPAHVVFKACDILPPNEKDNRLIDIRSIYSNNLHAVLPCVHLAKHVIRNDTPRMHVLGYDRSTEAGNALIELYRGLITPKASGATQSQYDNVRRKALMHYYDKAGAPQNKLPLKEAIDFIAKEMKRRQAVNDTSPIFYLSANNTARMMLSGEIDRQGAINAPIGVLTFGGLLEALSADKNTASNSALEEMGLSNNIKSYREAVIASHKLDEDYSMNTFEDVPYNDRTSKRRPFQDACKGLAEELLAARKDKDVEKEWQAIGKEVEASSASKPAASSRIARFERHQKAADAAKERQKPTSPDAVKSKGDGALKIT